MKLLLLILFCSPGVIVELFLWFSQNVNVNNVITALKNAAHGRKLGSFVVDADSIRKIPLPTTITSSTIYTATATQGKVRIHIQVPFIGSFQYFIDNGQVKLSFPRQRCILLKNLPHFLCRIQHLLILFTSITFNESFYSSSQNGHSWSFCVGHYFS